MKRNFSQAQVDTYVPDPDSAEDGAKVYERVAKRGAREVWAMVMERVFPIEPIEIGDQVK